jgi:hypothetical protein
MRDVSVYSFAATWLNVPSTDLAMHVISRPSAFVWLTPDSQRSLAREKSTSYDHCSKPLTGSAGPINTSI